MPELPEVETVRRGLAPHLEGARIARIALNRDGLRWPFPPDLAQVATGARIAALRRRAKYILADLDRSDARGPVSILIHLGMSGRMLVEAAPPPACGGGAADGGGTGPAAPGVFHRDPGVLPRHDHVVIETEAGARVVLNDARRFGMVDLVRGGQSPLLAGLGPEPLDDGFDGATLHAAMSGRRAPVKAMLLDQRVVAGLGNIYVAEALHRAGIDPRRAAGRISRPRLDRLAVAIRAVLLEAIAAGGSSLRDHRQATGELGYFQHSFRVYDREGAPCPTPGCSGVIRRLVQGGRSSFHCPRCQR